MAKTRAERVGDIRAAVRRMGALDLKSADAASRVQQKRRLVADLCRLLDPQPGPVRSDAGRGNGAAASGAAASGAAASGAAANGAARVAAELSPRMRQTLDRLLAGDSEKEIAYRFGRSPHTVHVYVKKLYQRFGVCSRGELFSRFVRADTA